MDSSPNRISLALLSEETIHKQAKRHAGGCWHFARLNESYLRPPRRSTVPAYSQECRVEECAAFRESPATDVIKPTAISLLGSAVVESQLTFHVYCCANSLAAPRLKFWQVADIEVPIQS